MTQLAHLCRMLHVISNDLIREVEYGSKDGGRLGEDRRAESSSPSCLSWFYESYIVPWLVVRVDDGSANDEGTEDMMKLKRELGIDLPSMKKRITSPKYKTCINLVVFTINFITLFLHTLFTEPETVLKEIEQGVVEDEKCQVKFFHPPRVNAMEFMLFIIFLVVPFLIAKAIKFIWENDSFSLLREWDDSMSKAHHQPVRDEMKKDLRTKKSWSYLFAILSFATCVLVDSFARTYYCPSRFDAYNAVQLVFNVIFFASGLFALIVTYNLVRMYTFFIRTCTALFQRDLKRDLAEHVSVIFWLHILMLDEAGQILTI